MHDFYLYQVRINILRQYSTSECRLSSYAATNSTSRPLCYRHHYDYVYCSLERSSFPVTSSLPPRWTSVRSAVGRLLLNYRSTEYQSKSSDIVNYILYAGILTGFSLSHINNTDVSFKGHIDVSSSVVFLQTIYRGS